jgi:hypothetical protein
MSWTEQLFRYCERGQDPGFWAEPLNALSNAAVLAAAAAAAARLGAEPAPDHRDGRRAAAAGLIALAVAVGAGSFLFHTFATRWARLADVVPIGLFMVGYLAFALRVFLGWSWAGLGAAVAAFLAATAVAASFSCPVQLGSAAAYAREPCLKGTMGYVPALIALLLTAALLRKRHPAARALIVAGGIFAIAMLLRWLDARSCGLTALLGRPRGTHALWHLLNALTLYVLLGAAIRSLAARA